MALLRMVRGLALAKMLRPGLGWIGLVVASTLLQQHASYLSAWGFDQRAIALGSLSLGASCHYSAELAILCSIIFLHHAKPAAAQEAQ
jgi:uncharacterized protein (DUF934 family)